MADRSVSVNLKADVSGFVTGMKRSEAATRDVAMAGEKAAKSAEVSASKQEAAAKRAAATAEAAAKKHNAAWEKTGRGMMLTGGAIAVGVGLAVKAFAQFDKEMSGVKAVSGANAKQMDQLGKAAIKAGADTVFSASEAAQAEAELAKAGVSTADILGGALTGSLSLASAGGLDLANAATIAAQAMNIFKLEGSDVGHIADVLASGANTSAADVGSLGDALKQGGLVAAQTGLHLEDTVGILSMFADNALVGSDAGTSLKTTLMRLVPSSVEAQNAMDAIGFSAYDAQGKFVGMESVANQLQGGLGKLTEQQRASTLNTIFGSDATRAASILYEEGAAGVKKYTEAMMDEGAAARMSGIMLDNLSGDFEGLKGSIDTALIQSGSAGNGVLRSLTQSATSAVNAFGDLPAPLQQGALGLAAAASAALLTGGAFLTVRAKITAVKVAMVEMEIASKLTRASMLSFATGPIGLALAGITVAVGLFAKSQMDAKGRADDLKASLDQQTGAITTQTRALVARQLQEDGSLKLATRLGISHELVTSAAMGEAKAIDTLRAAQTAASGVAVNVINNTTDQTEKMDLLLGKTDLFGSVSETSAQKTITSSQQSAAGYDLLLRSVVPISEALGTQTAAEKEVAAAALIAIDPVTGLTGAQTKLAAETKTAKEELDKFIQTLQDSGLLVLSTRDANRQWIQSAVDVTEALKKNGTGLDVNTQKGRDNAGVLDARANKALGLAKAIYSQTGSESAMRASLVTSRAALVKTYLQFDNNIGRANAYATSIIKIPPAKATNISLNGVDAAVTAADRLKARLALLPKNTNLNVHTSYTGTAPGQGHKEADGGVLSFFASGSERHIAQIAPAGAMRIWAEPETGGEAYIPLAASKRARSKEILENVAGRFGGQVSFMANGGIQSLAGGFVAADFNAMSGRIPTNVPSGADITGLRLRQAKATTALHTAESALYTLRHKARPSAARVNLAKERVSDAEGTLRTAKGTLARAKATTALHAAENALYALRHAKGPTTAQVRLAEDRLANSRGSLKAATTSLKGAETARNAAAKPYATRWHAAAKKSNAGTAAFLANIATLNSRGFTVLADQLVMAGDDEAYTLAAEAVKTNSNATALQSDVVASVANEASLAALQAAVDAKFNPTAAVAAPPPLPAWALPGISASAYGARPAPGKLQQIIVKIGDVELTNMISATVDGHTQQLVDGLVYGGSS